jgi:hypothetical protein
VSSLRLSRVAVGAGRDPATIVRAASLSLEDDPDTIARKIDAWRDAGFGYLVRGWPGVGRARIEKFAARHLGP